MRRALTAPARIAQARETDHDAPVAIRIRRRVVRASGIPGGYGAVHSAPGRGIQPRPLADARRNRGGGHGSRGFRGGDGRAWLLTIVRNSCYDRLRQKGASDRNTDFDEELHSAGRQAPNPETALLLAERSELLKKSLAELPAEYREVLILRELEQLSYREIADIAGIPLGTVMSRISRARQQLQRTLFGLRNEGAVDVVCDAHVGSGRVASDATAP